MKLNIFIFVKTECVDGRFNVGISVVVRITLKDGSYKEVLILRLDDFLIFRALVMDISTMPKPRLWHLKRLKKRLLQMG